MRSRVASGECYPTQASVPKCLKSIPVSIGGVACQDPCFNIGGACPVVST